MKTAIALLVFCIAVAHGQYYGSYQAQFGYQYPATQYQYPGGYRQIAGTFPYQYGQYQYGGYPYGGGYPFGGGYPNTAGYPGIQSSAQFGGFGAYSNRVYGLDALPFRGFK